MSAFALNPETVRQLRGLASAIRVGSERTEQAFGRAFTYGGGARGSPTGACALGAAMLSFGRNARYPHAWIALKDKFPLLALLFVNTGEGKRYLGRIVTLNDTYQWTRERIARFLERVAGMYGRALERQAAVPQESGVGR